MLLDEIAAGVKAEFKKEKQVIRPEDITAGYQIDPEKEKKFGKQVCQSLRGTVRVGIWNLGCDTIGLCVLFLILYWTLHGLPGWFLLLLHVPVIMVCVIHLWYQLSWELTFDGESGFFSYRTLFQQEIRFHVSEIRHFGVERVSIRQRRATRTCDMLFIEVGDVTISVRMQSYALGAKVGFMSGYVNADKLLEYLQIYQRFLASEEWGLVMDGVDPGISPGVAAAIAREKASAAGAVSLEKTEPEKVSLAKEAPEQASPVQAEPASFSSVKDAPEKAAPAETEPEAQAPPAEEKPSVDVDALFNSVLKEYGKNAPRVKPEKRRRRKW